MMADRIKTTLMLPTALALQVTELSERLGIGRNAVISLGTAMAVILFSRLVVPGRRRVAILRDIDAVVQKLMQEASDK